jgi:cupin superfamily acireductone dioxygenase involved in methionine salvage
MNKLFGVPLWHFRNFLTDEELKICYDELDCISSVTKHLGIDETIGGIETDLSNKDMHITSKLHTLFKSINSNVKIQNYWISESKPNTSVISHNHINPNQQIVVYSAVYYLQAENSGNLYLENPDQFGKLLGDTRYMITPSTNDLIIFPGWINHWVDTNTSNITRKCIAFDLVLN